MRRGGGGLALPFVSAYAVRLPEEVMLWRVFFVFTYNALSWSLLKVNIKVV